ncbi:MAG: NAD(P)H-dependent oxidoreductase [Pseudomonadota bacterium]
MTPAKIIAFSGSARGASINQKLAVAAAEYARAAGAAVTLINLRDYPIPLFDQDLEAEYGEPDNARELKALFAEHDGLLIASPEYNGLLSPLLKNTLDWLSRRAGDEASMLAYRGKTAALLASSYGRLGGLRGLPHARALLTNLGVLTVPEQATVGGAKDAFDDAGRLVRPADAAQVERVARSLVAAIDGRRAAGNGGTA